jgi:hypothetical protein
VNWNLFVLIFARLLNLNHKKRHLLDRLIIMTMLASLPTAVMNDLTVLV